MRITVATQGTEELERNFKRLAREVSVAYASRELQAALIEAMQPWVERARALARRAKVPKKRDPAVDPVHGADSIEVRPDRRRTLNRQGDLVLYGGPSRAHYWMSKIEFGTVRHQAWPFMRPAWAQTAAAILERASIALADRFERAVKRIALTQPGRGGRARDAAGRFIGGRS